MQLLIYSQGGFQYIIILSIKVERIVRWPRNTPYHHAGQGASANSNQQCVTQECQRQFTTLCQVTKNIGLHVKGRQSVCYA